MAAITQIIKYEGGNNTFIWKHPIEDFNTGAQLIAHESQEAILFLNGQAFDFFGQGRHTLEKRNLPLADKYFNLSTDSEAPFHCGIYFINKTVPMDVTWDTVFISDYFEPFSEFNMKISASGGMRLRAEDSRKLIVNIADTDIGISRDSLVYKFRTMITAPIETYFAQLVHSMKLNIFEMPLDDISKTLQHRLAPLFLDNGITLDRFFVSNIVKQKEDPAGSHFRELHHEQYRDMSDAATQQQTSIILPQTDKTIIEAQGISHNPSPEKLASLHLHGLEATENTAYNDVRNRTDLDAGIGVLEGRGGEAAFSFVQMQYPMGNMIHIPAGIDSQSNCAKCGKPLLSGAKFCLECGEPDAKPAPGIIPCPACGKPTPFSQFCIECGASLVNICPKCGIQLPPNAKFCMGCGQKL
jgi:membrane protease subunit (stomatin/prohibitin family)